MKIALVLALHDDDLDQYPPLGLGYVAAMLRREVPGVDPAFCSSLDGARHVGADLAFVTSASQNYDVAVQIGSAFARRRIPVFVGGVHISTMPESLHPVFTAGVIGEGEHTAVDLVNAFAANGAIAKDALASIPGLVFFDGGAIRRSPERDPVPDLDAIPHPDRALLGYGGGPAHVMTSRGCPYACSFCSSAAHWKNYRTFSVGYVMEEIDELVERFGTTHVHIYDDLFTANKKRLREFADCYEERGYPGRLTLSCAVRANLVDEETVGLLRRMRFERVTFGAESASDRVLCTLKSSVTAEQNRTAVALCHEGGLKVGLSFIVGAPEERPADMVQTYLFILKCVYAGHVDQADVNVLAPFPATPMWDTAKDAGIVGGGFRWGDLRTPWRSLLFDSSLKEAGVRMLLYDMKVRRMLERHRTPVMMLVPVESEVPAGLLDRLKELSLRDNAVNAGVVVTPGGAAPDKVFDEGRWPIVTVGRNRLGEVIGAAESTDVRPMAVLVRDADRLADAADRIRYVTWVHFEEAGDLTTIAGWDGLAVVSRPVLDELRDRGWPDEAAWPNADGLPGFKVVNAEYDAQRYAFDADIFPETLPEELVFREVADLYARLFAERAQRANLQNRLDGALAERGRASRAPAVSDGGGESHGKLARSLLGRILGRTRE